MIPKPKKADENINAALEHAQEQFELRAILKEVAPDAGEEMK